MTFCHHIKYNKLHKHFIDIISKSFSRKCHRNNNVSKSVHYARCRDIQEVKVIHCLKSKEINSLNKLTIN